jgi:hypothetical protein
MYVVRIKIIRPEREVCVISHYHQDLLNVVLIDFPGDAPLDHRWCMRHFVSNFYKACGNKELSHEYFCLDFTVQHFASLYNILVNLMDLPTWV